MKKQFVYLSLLSAAFLVSFTSSSQEVAVVPKAMQSPEPFLSKNSAPDPNFYMLTSGELPHKVMRSFEASFVKYGGLAWFKNGKNYLAMFQEGTMVSRAEYTKA